MKTTDGLERIKSLGIIAWTWVGIIILVSVILYLLYSIHTVLMPFLYAVAFVYVLRPIVNFLEDKGLPRILALVLSYIGMILVLTLFGMYIGPILFNEGKSLILKFPKYIYNVNGYVNEFVATHPFLRGEEVSKLITRFASSLSSFAQKAALSVPVLTASFFGGILNLILAPIIAFYILKDLNAIKTTVSDMIPERHRVEGMQIIRKVDSIVGGYLKGQAMVALSVAILSGISLSLLGIDYAILLGFLIGVFNIIPYLGPILGGAPAVIIALGTSWQLAVAVIVVLAAIQQFDSVVISPRIMSQQVNLHPSVVIFAILVGGTLFGFIGMLIAIPIAAVGKALYLHFRERNVNNGESPTPDLSELQPTTRL
ncbi:MAG: AI-2E family transporter [Actinobacteria bacterium]|nr:AI-2E family transporter [Actinomycetota bacterium]